MAAETSALAGLDALDLGPAPERNARQRAARIWAASWPKLAAAALVLAVWQLIYLTGWKHYVFPSPAATLRNLWDQARTGLLWDAIGTTLQRAVLGFAVALVTGTVAGALVARLRPLRVAAGSRLTGLQTMPSLAWVPVAIILFGSTTQAAILFVVVLAAAPSIANGLIAGVDYTPPLLLKAGTLMGLRRLSLYRHLILPASLPSFVAGLKQAWAFAWHGLMAGELLILIANTPSIGGLLSADQDQTDMPSTIAIMIVILLLGLIVDGLFGLANHVIRNRWGLS